MVLRRCRIVARVKNRAWLSRDAVSQMFAVASESGAGRVEVCKGVVSVVCDASWALNRKSRLVRAGLLDGNDAVDLSGTVRLSADVVELHALPREPDLSW